LVQGADIAAQLGPAGTEEHARAASLDRLRLAAHWSEVDQLAVVLGRFLRPERPHRLDGLAKSLPPVRIRDTGDNHQRDERVHPAPVVLGQDAVVAAGRQAGVLDREHDVLRDEERLVTETLDQATELRQIARLDRRRDLDPDRDHEPTLTPGVNVIGRCRMA
jgi:hypothetical protein